MLAIRVAWSVCGYGVAKHCLIICYIARVLFEHVFTSSLVIHLLLEILGRALPNYCM